MSLTIYTSRQTRGKNPAREKLITNIIQSYNSTSFNKRRKIFVLTPKQDTYQVERELIEKVGKKGLLGLQITAFDSFLRIFLSEDNHYPEILDSHGRLMLMQKALLDSKNDLTIYKKSVNKGGFTEQVIDQISELKLASIKPEDLLEKSKQINGSLLINKLNDLSYIYKNFVDLLGEDRLDEDDVRNFANTYINDSKFLKDTQIFLLDFVTLNHYEVLFLVLASKIAKNIEISINTDRNPTAPDMSAFIVQNQLISMFENYSKEFGVDLNIIDLKTNKKNGSLESLSSELFSYNPKKYNGNNSDVTLFREKDPWDEVIRVAQLILDENRKGSNFSEIALATNKLEDYQPIINRIFTQYQIPFFVDENHKVIDNHFIQSILFALEAVDSNFNRSDLISYLKSEFSSFLDEDIDLLENYLIEAGIRNWEWEKPFTRIPPSWKKLETEEILEDLNELRENILKDLDPFIKVKNKDKTFNEYIDILLKYLKLTDSQQKLEDLAELVALNNDQELSSRYRQIWNILLEVLNQMRRALGNTKTSYSEFISVLKSGLSSYEVGVIPEDNEAVIISSLERTILPEIKSLYFLGMNEGILPKSNSNETLLSEHDKEIISDTFNLKHLEIKNQRFTHELEEANLYQLLTKPKDKVTFLYHSYGFDGAEAFPSRYIDSLKKIYKKDLFKQPPKLFNILTPQRAGIILESLDSNSKMYKDLQSIFKEWYSENSDLDNPFLIDYLKSDDTLKKIKAQDLYSHNDRVRVSISRLERFSNCAFGHFLQYGLRPRMREEYEVRFLDTGIIIHEVFNTFISMMIDKTDNNAGKFNDLVNKYIKNLDSLKDDFSKVFKDILEKLEETKRYDHTAASRYLIRKIERLAFIAVLMILLQLKDSNYIPSKLEQYFVDRTSDKVSLEGRIDRVDIKETGDDKSVRIIDYKTGNKELTYKDLYYGTSLQLAVYLSEALKAYEGATRI